ncbi:hypothetical protein IZ6_10580 [Terrihabitans soli]|uniref:Uncharacterized protein n=1 Tax=Terrihabitans soli TaxID=708113 RepID=A0A6S6QGQ6_9HYPH|nr:hypothetical protein [Terrihabitans soli]BCJ90323.1 hypothetical protein IZ6_10580 [Terrihabitans soli]
MKKKIGGLEGRGVLRVEGQEDLPVYYSLAVMKEPSRVATSGEGKIWAEIEALQSRIGLCRLKVRGGDELEISLRPAGKETFVSFVTQSAIPGY